MKGSWKQKHLIDENRRDFTNSGPACVDELPVLHNLETWIQSLCIINEYIFLVLVKLICVSIIK